MRKLSGTIITFNEEKKIEAALESLQRICDEIVVVDSFSSDATVEICRSHDSSVHQVEWSGYSEQKQRAVELAGHDWILSLDADERLSDPLIEEIRTWKSGPEPREGGYLIPRRTFFMGRWIRHTCWYPDAQLRLFHRGCGRWAGRRLHESVQVEGKDVGHFVEHIDHYTYASVSEYLRQLERFSRLAAEDYREKGRRASLGRLTIYPVAVFVKNWILKQGFRDGLPGFVVSVLAGVSTFFNYLKLRELEEGRNWDPDWSGRAARSRPATKRDRG